MPGRHVVGAGQGAYHLLDERIGLAVARGRRRGGLRPGQRGGRDAHRLLEPGQRGRGGGGQARHRAGRGDDDLVSAAQQHAGRRLELGEGRVGDEVGVERLAGSGLEARRPQRAQVERRARLGPDQPPGLAVVVEIEPRCRAVQREVSGKPVGRLRGGRGCGGEAERTERCEREPESRPAEPARHHGALHALCGRSCPSRLDERDVSRLNCTIAGLAKPGGVQCGRGHLRGPAQRREGEAPAPTRKDGDAPAARNRRREALALWQSPSTSRGPSRSTRCSPRWRCRRS